MFQNCQTGFSTVEILVVSAIVLSMVSAIVVSFQVFFKLARHTEHGTQASLLLEEGAEALLSMRDLGWDTYLAPLSLGTPYELAWNGAMYQATTTPQGGAYARLVTLSEVQRDGADVVGESGAVDEDTLHARIEIRLRADDALLAEGDMLIHNAYAP